MKKMHFLFIITDFYSFLFANVQIILSYFYLILQKITHQNWLTPWSPWCPTFFLVLFVMFSADLCCFLCPNSSFSSFFFFLKFFFFFFFSSFFFSFFFFLFVFFFFFFSFPFFP